MCKHIEGRKLKDCKICDPCKHNRISRFCSLCPENLCSHKRDKYRCQICKDRKKMPPPKLPRYKGILLLIKASEVVGI